MKSLLQSLFFLLIIIVPDAAFNQNLTLTKNNRTKVFEPGKHLGIWGVNPENGKCNKCNHQFVYGRLDNVTDDSLQMSAYAMNYSTCEGDKEIQKFTEEAPDKNRPFQISIAKSDISRVRKMGSYGAEKIRNITTGVAGLAVFSGGVVTLTGATIEDDHGEGAERTGLWMIVAGVTVSAALNIRPGKYTSHCFLKNKNKEVWVIQ